MKSTLMVSERGQITLPASMRKRMGIRHGGVVKVEERGGRIMLSPAAVVDVEIYSDVETRRLIAGDHLTNEERKRLDARVARRKA